MSHKALTVKRRRAPTIINGTVPPRRKNEELRPREFLSKRRLILANG
jgi:hypothetical protein